MKILVLCINIAIIITSCSDKKVCKSFDLKRCFIKLNLFKVFQKVEIMAEIITETIAGNIGIEQKKNSCFFEIKKFYDLNNSQEKMLEEFVELLLNHSKYQEGGRRSRKYRKTIKKHKGKSKKHRRKGRT